MNKDCNERRKEEEEEEMEEVEEEDIEYFTLGNDDETNKERTKESEKGRKKEKRLN